MSERKRYPSDALHTVPRRKPEEKRPEDAPKVTVDEIVKNIDQQEKPGDPGNQKP